MRLPLVALLVLGSMAKVSGQSLPVISIAGQPFSADEVITENPKPNVRNVLLTKTIRVYRDSVGRTRVNVSIPPDPTATQFVNIYDPVAGIYYGLDAKNRVAWRRIDPASRMPALPSSPTKGGIPSAAVMFFPGSGDVHTKSEPLGTQLIAGLSVDGQRTTSAGPAISGCDENVAVNDNWHSPELQMTLLQKRSNCFGDGATRLENINRVEPEAILFQVPSDYTIVDQVPSRNPLANSPPPMPQYTLSRLPPPTTK